MRQTYVCTYCNKSTRHRVVCDACLIERGVSRVVVESTVAPIEVTPWSAGQAAEERYGVEGPALTFEVGASTFVDGPEFGGCSFASDDDGEG